MLVVDIASVLKLVSRSADLTKTGPDNLVLFCVEMCMKVVTLAEFNNLWPQLNSTNLDKPKVCQSRAFRDFSFLGTSFLGFNLGQ